MSEAGRRSEKRTNRPLEGDRVSYLGAAQQNFS